MGFREGFREALSWRADLLGIGCGERFEQTSMDPLIDHGDPERFHPCKSFGS